MSENDVVDRDIFACFALAGLTANPLFLDQMQDANDTADQLRYNTVKAAYRLADAMLKERENAPTK